MAVMKKYEKIKKQFPEILRAHYGLIKKSCISAGISQETYYRWRRESPEFARKCDEAEIVTGWLVKDKLIEKIQNNDTAAIIFYCKTKLRHEGFVERIEATGRDGGAIAAIEIARKLTSDERDFFEQRMQIERENILREQGMLTREMKVVSESVVI